MNIQKFLLRLSQTSLFREENAENLAIFQIEANDQFGHIVLEEACYKRDVDSEFYTDNRNLIDQIDSNDLLDLSLAIWNNEPEHTAWTPQLEQLRINCEHSIDIKE